MSRAFLSAALFAFLVGHAASAGKAEDQKADLLEQRKSLAKRYDLEIVTEKLTLPVKTTYGAIDGKQADEAAVGAYLKLFLSEFQLYPPSLPKRAQLKRVVFCTELSYAGRRVGGLPDFENGTLYLNVTAGAGNKPYQRKACHHELFHLVDFRDDGLLYEDERWKSLNPSEFKYGTGGWNAQGIADSGLLTEKYPGFLNHYSTTGVEEDKAMLYANLIVESEYVAGRVKEDKVLKSKVELMKTLMLRFCPDIDDAFWERAGKLNRYGGTVSGP
jgi:hypothetical protein